MNLTETPKDLKMNSSNTPEELETLKKLLKNKQKIRLIFPYAENAEIKKGGAKWDSVNKIWYYPSINGDLPEVLKKYKAHKVFIEFENKEFYKPVLQSMKFDKIEKVWYVNQEDYDKFLTLG